MNIYQEPAVLVTRSGTYLEPWQKILQLLTVHRFCKKKKKMHKKPVAWNHFYASI